MTRRGSIVYYLAALVCGCFFLAAALQAHSLARGMSGENWGRDLLFIYFFTLVGGLFPQLMAAFLLRRVTRGLGWSRGWQWLLVGTLVSLGILWGLAQLGLLVERTHFSFEYQRVKAALLVALLGPMVVAGKPFWLPIPAFVATAGVLFLIQRAFAQHPSGSPG